MHVDELLSAYLSGDVTPDERAAIERRLAEDAQLREQLRELRALVALLSQHERPITADTMADFRRRIEEHIGAPVSKQVFAHLLSASLSGDVTDAERKALELYLARNPVARNESTSLRAMSQFLKKAELQVSPAANQKLLERLSATIPAAALSPVLSNTNSSAPLQPSQLVAAGLSGDVTDAERTALDAYLAGNPAARNNAASLRAMSQFLKKGERRVSPAANQKLLERLSASVPAAALAPVLPKATETVAMQLQPVLSAAASNAATVRIFVAQENPWKRRMLRASAAVAALLLLSAGTIFGFRALSHTDNSVADATKKDVRVDDNPVVLPKDIDATPGREPVNHSDGLEPHSSQAENPPTLPGNFTPTTDATTSTQTNVLPHSPNSGEIDVTPPTIPGNHVNTSDVKPTPARPTDMTTSTNPRIVGTPAEIGTPAHPDTVMIPGGVLSKPVAPVPAVTPTPVTPGPTAAATTTSVATGTGTAVSATTATGTGTSTSTSVNQGSETAPTNTDINKTGSPSPNASIAPVKPTTDPVTAPLTDKMRVAILRNGAASADTPAGLLTVQQSQELPSNTEITTDDNARIAIVLPGKNGRLWINKHSKLSIELNNLNTVVKLVSGEISYRAPDGGSLTVNQTGGVQVAEATGTVNVNSDSATNSVVTSVMDKAAKVVRKNKSTLTVRRQMKATIKLDSDDTTVVAFSDQPDKWRADLVVPGDSPDGSAMIPFGEKQSKSRKK